ncbi:hypothetical protein BJY01DRAFT_246374 [Aspergillus pseudoustus]|uniref:Mmc1 C-terminal domain-containing protein n=1 Tax=Aspergillus pseudoustus TaxID=1810923 RepID=A0ABR4K8L4_9EURO
MPLKLRGSLPKSLPHARDPTAKRIPHCPSCALTLTQRRTLVTRRTRPQSQSQSPIPRLDTSLRPLPNTNSKPNYSTSPSTAHTARHVPPRLRELYESLVRIQAVAPEQVNLSRLQLALRGLESEGPLIRVAGGLALSFLGLNDVSSARKLVRLLLADPLKEREDWEDMLDNVSGENGGLERGLLIRYGEVSESISNHLVPTISVPSQVLKKGNLEILVTSLGAGSDVSSAGAQLSADTFLVPTVTIQTSHTGRHNMVRYPVHRSIVCAEGVDGLLAYSGLISQADLGNEASSIYAAVEAGASGPCLNNDRVAFVDTTKADEALAKFRESVQNATLYERGWTGSGVQQVVEWLSSLRGEENALNPSLKSLITSLVDSAEQRVVTEENRRVQQVEEGSVPEGVREDLDRTVSAWAETAHTELRGALEEGFATKQWRGLAWWKLFWHVDDVGMITSEILEKKYLRGSEKAVIWTAGQLDQAGLRVSEKETTIAPAPTEASADTDIKNVAVAIVEAPREEQVPWPTQITRSRARLLEETVPSLQALAQRLVLFSLSTTSLTSALSVLTYVSFPASSIYETCTMAAVGLIYSLRRQQRKWDAARTFWEEEVREEGRTALLETEEQLRTTVRNGGKSQVEVTDHEGRKAITEAREALDNVH